MKLAVYGPQRLGLVIGDRIIDLQQAAGVYLSSEDKAEALVGHTLRGFFERGDEALKTAQSVHYFVRGQMETINTAQKSGQIVFPVKEAKLSAPVTDSFKFKIMCIATNFADHVVGMQSNLPVSPGDERKKITIEGATSQVLSTAPWGFYKLGANVSNPEDDVPYPSRTKRLDYEGEVALMIGKRGKDIKRSELFDYVFGYTLFDDFSLRDNMDKGTLNFAMVKNFEGSAAVGPIIALKDEIPDPQDIDFSTTVNGEVKQRGNTKDMIRSFGEWIELLSADVVLNPGDIIVSGTCAGTGLDTSERDKDGNLKPDKFLKIGDVVEVSSKKIGATLRNRIVAKRLL